MVNVIVFKSTPVNWTKERDGLKCNTVRVQDIVNDCRFKSPCAGDLIVMVNNVTYEAFTRILSDVTKLNNITVYSWREK